MERTGKAGPLIWRELNKEHGMISSEAEMRAVREFFAQHLDLEEGIGAMGGEDGEVIEITQGVATMKQIN